MLPIRTRHRLTAATLAILALAAILSVALSQPSAARPAAVETLELEPATVTPEPTSSTIPGTIPPAWTHHLYFPMVAGDSEATE